MKVGIGLYIHIPFCIQKCRYCAFNSTARFDQSLQEHYVDVLLQELEFRMKNLENKIIKYVYIGGGTPNTLPIDSIKRIVSIIPNTYTEFSIELNPGTGNLGNLNTSLGYLSSLKSLGVNRISVGVQSFDDNLLTTLGRVHSAQDAISLVENIKIAGFDNFSIDLIIAQPKQSFQMVLDDVLCAVELRPTHVSTYLLSIDEDTVFHKLQEFILPILPSDKETEKMYYTIEKSLEDKGYNHYEISNYAKQGFECRYNLNTWKNGEYIGIGLGAGSYFGGEHYSNVSSLKGYLLSAGKYRRPSASTENSIDKFEVALMLGLRLSEGIDISNYLITLPENYVGEFMKRAESCINDKLINLDDKVLKLRENKKLLLDLTVRKLLM